MKIRVLMTAMTVLTLLTVSQAYALDYIGVCEASAGAFIGDKHFVVASDETNVLQIYERGKPAPVGSADMMKFTGFDKSDLEAAARIGDRVFWISSHSYKKAKKGKPRRPGPERNVFFATKIGQANGLPMLTGDGKVVTNLLQDIVKATGVKEDELDVEAMAATPEGGLLIGLRAPLSGSLAIAVVLKNPAAVVDSGAAAEFAKVEKLDLKGLAFRSMERFGGGYVILAGSVADSSDAFVAYRWAGPGTSTVDKIDTQNLAGIKPEGAMAVPGSNLVQLLSDDGDLCSDEEGSAEKRMFRSIDITP